MNTMVETEKKEGMNVHVMVRKVYGIERFYPMNQDTKIMCTLMGVATFTKEQLKLCKSHGWTVTVKTEDYILD